MQQLQKHALGDPSNNKSKCWTIDADQWLNMQISQNDIHEINDNFLRRYWNIHWQIELLKYQMTIWTAEIPNDNKKCSNTKWQFELLKCPMLISDTENTQWQLEMLKYQMTIRNAEIPNDNLNCWNTKWQLEMLKNPRQ